MAVVNADISAAFEEIADLLELANDNPFRIRAYRNAARIVGSLRFDVATELKHGRELPRLRGIGEDLAGKIREIAASGSCALLRRLRRAAPRGITSLLQLPGLGPKRVALLYRKRRIRSVEELRRAARSGKLRGLPGFGARLEEKVLAAAVAHFDKRRRFKLATAARYAEPYAEYLRRTPGVDQVVIAGSYRRRRDTVGDLDFLATARSAGPVVARFTSYPAVKEVLASGRTRASVRLNSGIQADLRVVAPESFGAALHYFTGSKAHNIALRRLAMAQGLKVNEYGVFRGAKRVAGETEESVYAAVGLPWVPPEKRES
jgi:DNA polymerase (family 10)